MRNIYFFLIFFASIYKTATGFVRAEYEGSECFKQGITTTESDKLYVSDINFMIRSFLEKVGGSGTYEVASEDCTSACRSCRCRIHVIIRSNIPVGRYELKTYSYPTDGSSRVLRDTYRYIYIINPTLILSGLGPDVCPSRSGTVSISYNSGVSVSNTCGPSLTIQYRQGSQGWSSNRGYFINGAPSSFTFPHYSSLQGSGYYLRLISRTTRTDDKKYVPMESNTIGPIEFTDDNFRILPHSTITLGEDDLNVQYTSPGVTCPRFMKVSIKFENSLTIFSNDRLSNNGRGSVGVISVSAGALYDKIRGHHSGGTKKIKVTIESSSTDPFEDTRYDLEYISVVLAPSATRTRTRTRTPNPLPVSRSSTRSSSKTRTPSISASPFPSLPLGASPSQTPSISVSPSKCHSNCYTISGSVTPSASLSISSIFEGRIGEGESEDDISDKKYSRGEIIGASFGSFAGGVVLTCIVGGVIIYLYKNKKGVNISNEMTTIHIRETKGGDPRAV